MHARNYSILLLLFIAINLPGIELPDSTTVIYGWELSGYTTPELSDIDTLVMGLHDFNPIHRYSKNNTTLGNLGSAYISNDYFERLPDKNIPFLASFSPYFYRYDKVTFINTRKPYSHLFYTNAGGSRDKEEVMDVFHSQNVNQYLNFGLSYNLFASKGQYLYQDVKKNSFRIFTSYTRDFWQSHATVNVNQYKTGESGGVQDSLYRTDDFRFNKEIPVIFEGTGEPYYNSNVYNKLRYVDFMLSNSLNINGLLRVDSARAEKKGIGEPIISYVIRGRRASKIYTDASPFSNTYYQHIYSNINRTYDSLGNYELVNTLQLDFKTELAGKVRVGAYAAINSELQHVVMYTLHDTLQEINASDSALFLSLTDTLREYHTDKKLSNYYVSGGIYGNLFGKVEATADGSLYFLGSKAGQMRLKGNVNTQLNVLKKEIRLDVDGRFENLIPGYMESNYISNHLMYAEDFAPVKRVHLSGALSAPSNFFRIWADYALLSGEIYYQDGPQPQQYNSPLNLLRVGLSKDFNIWKLCSRNKVVNYLFSENENVVQVPQVMFYNSTYIDHTWHFNLTGGELRTMLGVDVYYSSRYYGYGYDPVSSRYYTQNRVKVGGTPYIDAFLNIKIKQARGFFKMEHINSELFNDNLYAAVYYPQNTMTFKFGVAWTFYN